MLKEYSSVKNAILRESLFVLLVTSIPCSLAHGEIYFDDFTDEAQPYEYRLTIGGQMSFEADGLAFVASSPAGIEVITEDGALPASDSWSIRAEFTINALNGLGLAGVGITSPDRWAAVLAAERDQEYGVAQNFNPDKLEINNGDITESELFGAPFVVQMDFTGDSLSGYFWRPETPTDVIAIEYGRSLSGSPGLPRLANNGSDMTYRAIWLSESLLPLPTGFEDVGDLDGNEIINVADIDLLATHIRGDKDVAFDLNGDGELDLNDQSTLIEEYLGTQLGDANLDGTIDFADFLALSASFGQSGGWTDGDFDASGDVQFPDFLFLSKNYGAETQAIAAVPEPSGLLLLIAASSWVSWRRRKR